MSPASVRWLAALAAALAAPTWAADVCRWKDEAGKVQFGDCRLAPAQNSRVDTRPANSDVSAPKPLPPKPASAPSPAAWTPACDAIARRVMTLPKGTPFHEEGRQIEQQCPGLAFRCDFDYAKPANNRCGPIPDKEFTVTVSHRNFPKGAETPNWRDAPPTSF